MKAAMNRYEARRRFERQFPARTRHCLSSGIQQSRNRYPLVILGRSSPGCGQISAWTSFADPVAVRLRRARGGHALPGPGWPPTSCASTSDDFERRQVRASSSRRRAQDDRRGLQVPPRTGGAASEPPVLLSELPFGHAAAWRTGPGPRNAAVASALSRRGAMWSVRAERAREPRPGQRPCRAHPTRSRHRPVPGRHQRERVSGRARGPSRCPSCHPRSAHLRVVTR